MHNYSLHVIITKRKMYIIIKDIHFRMILICYSYNFTSVLYMTYNIAILFKTIYLLYLYLYYHHTQFRELNASRDVITWMFRNSRYQTDNADFLGNRHPPSIS